MPHFWVVGTDTDVGKTCITTLLMRQLQQHNLRAVPYKPVQTGAVTEQGRTYYHDTKMYETYSLQKLNTAVLNSYSFKEPASPHFAAHLEGQQIDQERLIQHIQTLKQVCDVVICEGAGGIMVPMEPEGKSTLLDVIVESCLPVVVVAHTKLGTINHTLLTLEALAARRVEVLGLVFNGHTQTAIEVNNIETILHYQKLPYAVVPQLQNIQQVIDYPIQHTSLFERLLQHEASVN